MGVETEPCRAGPEPLSVTGPLSSAVPSPPLTDGCAALVDLYRDKGLAESF